MVMKCNQTDLTDRGDENGWPGRVPGRGEFERVKEEAERLCQAATGGGFDGLVDGTQRPHCVDVGWLVADDGSARWRVAIENVGMDDRVLMRWLKRELSMMGIKAVVFVDC
jgi:hypothetical protein